MTKGSHHSEESRLKIGRAGLGRKHTQEWKDAMSETMAGRVFSCATRVKLREARLNQPSSWSKGKHFTLEHRRQLGARGEKHHWWKGGITELNKKIRTSLDYRIWRQAVFTRDDYTCQGCGHRGGELNADHIKPFSLFPESRFELSNGRTLCKPCHFATSTFGSKLHTYANSI